MGKTGFVAYFYVCFNSPVTIWLIDRLTAWPYVTRFLPRIWKQKPRKNVPGSKDESGKPYWDTPGRFLPKNMLMSFVEEMGHEYDELLEGASRSSRDDDPGNGDIPDTIWYPYR
ncbi:hypothetical protein VTN77DRAFT_560 [Rasamsonia byssochlamydoides]|uniref:uncharacterized protein n=1 Tax=Rasamsonia byssochlamydoides TaxID=89139 RepID=UPI0037422FE3